MINTLKYLAYSLKVDQSELLAICENIENFYYERVTPKLDKHNKPKLKHGIEQKRIINPSINRLKVIQKRILSNILNKIPLPEYAYGAIKGRDNLSNAKKHKGKKYKFTTDLRDFFPSVTNKMVFEMFIFNGFSPTVARFLVKLTTLKGHLPQGASTSPMLANLVFQTRTKDLLEITEKYNLTFTSFIDDVTFSSSVNFKDQISEILNVLKTAGFKISHSKTYYKSSPAEVTGILVKNNTITITESFRKKLKLKENETPAQMAGKKRYARRIKESNKKRFN
ncbi:MAG: reverse transcriptase family protein [Bacteroidia bacterium]|nr:reverse transcriptase family protein [Bacteroidia bacterium]